MREEAVAMRRAIERHYQDRVEGTDEETGTTPEEQSQFRRRWFLLERGTNEVHPDLPARSSAPGKAIVAPLPVLIQVYYPGTPGKVCHCYYEVVHEFYECLFGEPYVEGEHPMHTCPHVGHFVELEEVIKL